MNDCQKCNDDRISYLTCGGPGGIFTSPSFSAYKRIVNKDDEFIGIHFFNLLKLKN